MKKLRLKPQDIFILLRLLFWPKGVDWKYFELAQELNMSQSEVFEGIKRARLCGLYDPLTKRPQRNALTEFIVYGLRYAFPVLKGEFGSGIPTAHSASPLKNLLISDDQDVFIWPFKKGKVKGIGINPLYKSVPEAIQNLPELYELLALIDALRLGKAREREIAKKEITKRISTA